MPAFQRVGRLRHRVALQAKALEYDDLGRQARSETSWYTVARPFAEVRELSGRELERANQMSPDVTHQVTIRFREEIGEDYRFLHRNRELEIRAILDRDTNRRELVCLCGEDRKREVTNDPEDAYGHYGRHLTAGEPGSGHYGFHLTPEP